MREIRIHPRIVQAMRLSPNEKAVFDVFVKNKNNYGKYTSLIAKESGVSNKIVKRILFDLEKCGVALQIFAAGNIRPRWKYKNGLERFESRQERRLRFAEQVKMCAEEYEPSDK